MNRKSGQIRLLSRHIAVGIAQFAFAVLFCSTVIGAPQNVNDAWTPPKNPDPQAILNDAENDAKIDNYAKALAEQVWFHENALKYDEGQYGVRLSFALSSWIELGKAYPPALEKLKSIRDGDEKKVRDGQPARELFSDLESINKYLKENDRSKVLFEWLDANHPKDATNVFDLAEPDLITAKEYKLCGKYVNPKSIHEMIKDYQMTKTIAKGSQFKDGRLNDYNENSFSRKSATLVALLVVNGRKEDAEQVFVQALNEKHDKDFKALLEKAKSGDVPAPWP